MKRTDKPRRLAMDDVQIFPHVCRPLELFEGSRGVAYLAARIAQKNKELLRPPLSAKVVSLYTYVGGKKCRLTPDGEHVFRFALALEQLKERL